MNSHNTWYRYPQTLLQILQPMGAEIVLVQALQKSGWSLLGLRGKSHMAGSLPTDITYSRQSTGPGGGGRGEAGRRRTHN